MNPKLKWALIVWATLSLGATGFFLWKKWVSVSQPETEVTADLNRDAIFQSGEPSHVKIGDKDSSLIRPFGKDPFPTPGKGAVPKYEFKKDIPEHGFDIDLERELYYLVDGKFPEGKVLEEQSAGNSRVRTEQLEGDATVQKVFGPNGRLTGEKWERSSGDVLSRSYYSNGHIKGFKWTRSDGTETVVTMNAKGEWDARKDRLPGGDQLVTQFGPARKVVERWRVARDGRRVPLKTE